MQNKVMMIHPDGSIECIYDDNLSHLAEPIGKMEMKRASNVEWDDDSQTWYVIRDGIILLTGYKNRGDAIDAEIEFLNKEMWDASQV